jgi:catechol-2,3-dioxygenase
MSTITQTSPLAEGSTRTLPMLEMSHFEIRVQDLTRMLTFYTETLGFVITDRGTGPDGLIFLSRSRDEHHQVVLNPAPDGHGDPMRIDHIAFRVSTLSGLRAFRSRLAASVGVETVTHGTTWSLYFHDPEHNRIEIFTDTPWHVEQPTRLPVSLDVDDARLHETSRELIQPLPGFASHEAWAAQHRKDMRSPPASS